MKGRHCAVFVSTRQWYHVVIRSVNCTFNGLISTSDYDVHDG